MVLVYTHVQIDTSVWGPRRGMQEEAALNSDAGMRKALAG